MSGSHERSDPRETIELQNVVASTGIKQELDLESVAIDLLGADYNPNNFPGIVYRTEEPRAATLIFRSGKMVATGASSVEDVHATLDGVFEDLRELGIEITDDPEITVQNMVASADFGQRLNLNATVAISAEGVNLSKPPSTLNRRSTVIHRRHYHCGTGGRIPRDR